MILKFEYNFKINKSIVELVDELISYADANGASDIHIDPRYLDVRVRFRVDGVLYEVCAMPLSLYAEFIARIKIISGLKIDERIVPQDGRISAGANLDVRVTTVASYYGESVVMRLLRRNSSICEIEDLGFSLEDKTKILKILKDRQGLVLLAGPTGCGKTTTLYSLLNKVTNTEISTVTIEDPIEYALPNARQIQVQQKRGVNFANGLRSILRQDPDVIMVGEIRDHDTAAMAANAALTGHMVFSTIHTNDAISTVMRMVEMGVESYLVAATLRLIISQRLVRKLCIHCRKKSEISTIQSALIKKYSELFLDSNTCDIFTAFGCEKCSGTGYRGRMVVSEILIIDELIRQLIVERLSVLSLKNYAKLNGMLSLSANAISKFASGETSFEEIIKIIHE